MVFTKASLESGLPRRHRRNPASLATIGRHEGEGFPPQIAHTSTRHVRVYERACERFVQLTWGLIRVGALAAISAGGLRVIGALLPVDQQSIGLAVPTC